MKILITGYRGLIGQRIYERLKLYHHVDGYERRSNYSLKKHNVKYDIIIHCAANCIIRAVIENSLLMIENINITYDVMELARRTGCKKVVIFSSSRVEHPNENPYIASKKFAENIAKAYRECYGINYLILRPETVWGMNDKDRVIPRWIGAAANNQSIIIYGDKNKELPPVYVDDFVDVAMDLINNFEKHKNKTYSISSEAMKVGEIINMIKKVFKSKSKVKYLPAEKTQPQKHIKPNIEIENKFEERLKEIAKYRLYFH